MSRYQLPLLAVACALVVLPLLGGPQPLDDALITLRYARSLAEGDGFVFNAGEHVLGTTTPLFTLLLAAAHRLTGVDLVWLAYAAACSAHLGCVLALALAGARCGFPLAGALAAALFGLAPIALHPTVGCMETSLFILATLAALLPSARPAGAWRAVAAAVAVLVRPEGLLTAVLYIVDVARSDARVALRRAVLVGLLVLPWAAFATFYFGSPLAQSVSAKWSVRSIRPPLLAAEQFWYLLVSLPLAAPRIQIQSFVPLPFGSLIAYALPLDVDLATRRLLVLAFGVVVLAVTTLGALALCRRNRAIVALLLFSVAYVGAFCVARPPMFPWYLVPPQPALLLAFVVGAGVILQAISRRATPLLATVAAVLLIGLSLWQSHRYLQNYPATVRVRGYRAAVERLGAAGQDPNVRIAAYEIGAIGYYSRAKILDHDGLVSPELLGLDPGRALERFRPHFYIAYQGSLGNLTSLPEFREHYELYAYLPEYAYQNAALVVYRRRQALGEDDASQ